MTYLPFLWRLQDHMFLKPEVTKDFASRVGHRFASDYEPRLNIGVYDSLLDLAARTTEELADLKPRDRIDVRSFIWVIGNYKEGTGSPSTNSDSTGQLRRRAATWRAPAGGYRVDTMEDRVTETETGYQRRRLEQRIEARALRASLARFTTSVRARQGEPALWHPAPPALTALKSLLTGHKAARPAAQRRHPSGWRRRLPSSRAERTETPMTAPSRSIEIRSAIVDVFRRDPAGPVGPIAVRRPQLRSTLQP